MKTNPRRENRGFTLIELMAVITIIVILAGLVVGGMGFVNERQAKEKAKVQIALLSKAIEEYKLDMGAYPGTAANTNINGLTGSPSVSAELYQALFKDGYDFTNPTTPPANWTKARTIYLPELDPRATKQGWVTTTTNATPQVNLAITDPWGNPYRYRKGTAAVNPDFDLWSMGKDGLTQPGNSSTPYDPKHAQNRDDIRNF